MPAKNNNTLDLFEASVRREFAFLERDFAFPTPTRVPCDGGCVIRYLSPKVRVDLCYGAPEFEVILAFARADGGENLSVGDLLAGRARAARDALAGDLRGLLLRGRRGA